MPLIIGVSLALAVGVLYTIFRLDRDRAFYPTVMIVIASYYALFAVMGASTHPRSRVAGWRSIPAGRRAWLQNNPLDCGGCAGSTRDL